MIAFSSIRRLLGYVQIIAASFWNHQSRRNLKVATRAMTASQKFQLCGSIGRLRQVTGPADVAAVQANIPQRSVIKRLHFGNGTAVFAPLTSLLPPVAQLAGKLPWPVRRCAGGFHRV
jgi:hypothetical protein